MNNKFVFFENYGLYLCLQILYISRSDFFEIVKRYPLEASYFETCLREIKAQYTLVIEEYAMRNNDVSYIIKH